MHRYLLLLSLRDKKRKKQKEKEREIVNPHLQGLKKQLAAGTLKWKHASFGEMFSRLKASTMVTFSKILQQQ